MTTAHRMTDLQTRALAAFIHESRPDWDSAGVVASLRALRDDVDAWTLAIAMIRGAADGKNKTPGAPRYANNRCWDIDARPSCTVHGLQPRRADTGECAACYTDRAGVSA